jgi:hypothetical protein
MIRTLRVADGKRPTFTAYESFGLRNSLLSLRKRAKGPWGTDASNAETVCSISALKL